MYILYGYIGTLNVGNFWSIMPVVNCKWKVFLVNRNCNLTIDQKMEIDFTTQAPNLPV